MTKIKLTTLLFIALVSALVFSGCAKKTGPAANNQNQNSNAPATTTVATSTQETVIDTTDIDTSDWKTYRNEEYGFEFKYPEDSTIKISSAGNYLKIILIYNNKNIEISNYPIGIEDSILINRIKVNKDIFDEYEDGRGKNIIILKKNYYVLFAKDLSNNVILGIIGNINFDI